MQATHTLLPSPHSSPPTLLAREALQRRLSPVIIDNTNTAAWEMKPYVTMVSGGWGGDCGGGNYPQYCVDPCYSTLSLSRDYSSVTRLKFWSPRLSGNLMLESLQGMCREGGMEDDS